MKKQTTVLLSAIAALTLSLTSCKKDGNSDQDTATDTVATTVPDTNVTTSDTAQAAPVNDSNTSGTTSGKMEQVP